MRRWRAPKVGRFCLFWIYFLEVVMCSSLRPSSNISVPTISSRIVGGVQVDIENYPYQVSMQYRGRHICGASVVSTKFVVTAAHCTYRMSTSSTTFRAGSSTRAQGGQVVRAKIFHQHPKFNYDTVDYDVAAVEVTPKLIFNTRLKSIAIGSSEPKEGTSVTASGWGTLSETSNRVPNELRAVEIPVVNRAQCKRAYSRKAVITDRMICAGKSRKPTSWTLYTGGKDTCQGDSGGPLVSSGKLVGVVSWGFGCGRSRYPGVYTNLNNKEIRSFVKRVTGI